MGRRAGSSNKLYRRRSKRIPEVQGQAAVDEFLSYAIRIMTDCKSGKKKIGLKHAKYISDQLVGLQTIFENSGAPKFKQDHVKKCVMEMNMIYKKLSDVDSGCSSSLFNTQFTLPLSDDNANNTINESPCVTFIDNNFDSIPGCSSSLGSLLTNRNFKSADTETVTTINDLTSAFRNFAVVKKDDIADLFSTSESSKSQDEPDTPIKRSALKKIKFPSFSKLKRCTAKTKSNFLLVHEKPKRKYANKKYLKSTAISNVINTIKQGQNKLAEKVKPVEDQNTKRLRDLDFNWTARSQNIESMEEKNSQVYEHFDLQSQETKQILDDKKVDNKKFNCTASNNLKQMEDLENELIYLPNYTKEEIMNIIHSPPPSVCREQNIYVPENKELHIDINSGAESSSTIQIVPEAEELHISIYAEEITNDRMHCQELEDSAISRINEKNLPSPPPGFENANTQFSSNEAIIPQTEGMYFPTQTNKFIPCQEYEMENASISRVNDVVVPVVMDLEEDFDATEVESTEASTSNINNVVVPVMDLEEDFDATEVESTVYGATSACNFNCNDSIEPQTSNSIESSKLPSLWKELEEKVNSFKSATDFDEAFIDAIKFAENVFRQFATEFLYHFEQIEETTSEDLSDSDESEEFNPFFMNADEVSIKETTKKKKMKEKRNDDDTEELERTRISLRDALSESYDPEAPTAHLNVIPDWRELFPDD